jgi:hypothetical protein
MRNYRLSHLMQVVYVSFWRHKQVLWEVHTKRTLPYQPLGSSSLAIVYAANAEVDMRTDIFNNFSTRGWWCSTLCKTQWCFLIRFYLLCLVVPCGATRLIPNPVVITRTHQAARGRISRIAWMPVLCGQVETVNRIAPHAVAVHRWNMQTMRYFRMLALPMTSRPMSTKALATTTPFLLPLKSVCKLSYHSSNPEETCKWFQGGRSRWLLFFKMYQLSWQGEM